MATNADPQSGTATPAEPQPKRLGKYVIQKRLGAGGMGTVYLALDTGLNRTVALKILPKQRAANAQLVRRFNAEGQSAARLEHDHIVKVFESGQIDGHLYLALEFVDGLNVEELVHQRGTLPVRRTIEIVRQVASALQHAYERSIVHRDIKPSNLLIRHDGIVKLADMGLARVIDETVETSITRDGMTVGTVDFMAPEQAHDSKRADIRSDLYSLGCTWYQMLTGQPPYPEGSVTEKLTKHHSAPPPDPRRLNERVPEGIVAVLHKLMAKRPVDRYQTPQELIEDLKQTHLGRTGLNAQALANLANSEAELESHRQQDDAPASAPVIMEPGASNDSHGPSAAAQGTASPRSTRTEVPDVPQKGRYKPLKDRPVPPRSRPAGAAAAKTAAPKEKRELPPRSENPEALGVSQRRIDPELLKFVFFGTLALGVMAAVGWGIYSLGGFGDDDQGSILNPYLSQTGSGHGASTSTGPPVSANPYGNQRPAPPDEGDESPEPNAQLTHFEKRTPFPGAEDAEQNPAWDVPDWAYELRAPPSDDLKTLVVSSPAGAGQYATIDAAFDAMPRSGGIIEIAGRGPFPLDLHAFDDGRRVVLRAVEGQSPVLTLEQDISPLATAYLALKGGSLTVQGLHIVASGRGFPAGSAVFAMEGGGVWLQDCTLTLADPAAAPVAALRLNGAARPTRCVLENVVTRGNSFAALSTLGQGIGIAVGNCLFASGNSPAIVVANPSRMENHSEAETPPAVSIHWLSSAAVSRNAAALFAHGAGLPAPDVRVRTRRLALAAASTSDAAGLVFEAWPQNVAEDLEHPRPQGLLWESESTYWIGWPTWVRMHPLAGAEVPPVIDEAGWAQFWRSTADSRSFVPAPADAVGGDHSRLRPNEVVEWLESALATAADAPAALALPSLPEAPESLIQRLLARSERPRIPETFGVPPAAGAVRIDLEKDGLKLNDILNSSRCPDGSRVVLVGSGREVMEPVIIKDKTLRIEFESSDDVFVIEPVARSGDERPDALIRVERGHLDLVGAPLRIPSSATRNYPLRVLHFVDSTFSIRNCSLQGAFREGAQDHPVVEWTRTAESAENDAASALIDSSFIGGRFQAIGGDLAGRFLDLRNCVLFSLGAGLRCTLPQDSQSAGFLHLADSTVSAASALFQMDPSAAGRIHVFTERCVFGPAVDADPAGPAVLVYGASTDPARNLVWWDERSAYERQFVRYRIAESQSAAASQDFNADWVRAWGPDHIVDPLVGPTAVILDAPLPTSDKTTAASFMLKAGSGAAGWAPGGGAVGAQTAAIGPGAQAAAQPASSQTQTPGAARPRTQPDF